MRSGLLVMLVTFPDGYSWLAHGLLLFVELLIFARGMARPTHRSRRVYGLPLVGLGSFAVQTALDGMEVVLKLFKKRLALRRHMHVLQLGKLP